ncbi:MAG TPA: uracil-DNA glycosylase family protein [Flavobacteriales bacterium]|nr:uracil-DNA glycosylase family protein [Flavobacteriales bacterium]
MQTLAHHILDFLFNLRFKGKLPSGIGIMNPLTENDQVKRIVHAFYTKFYNDTKPRQLILGINPGRHGAGVTGVPFTDTKRLKQCCGITYEGRETHEPSSVFIYKMIEAYGGPQKFYSNFYISAVSPLGFTRLKDEKEINYNYYDDPALLRAVYPFAVNCLKKQLQWDLRTNVCFCFGTGKNEKFIRTLNEEHKFFGKVVALEHPRFIVQYKSKSMDAYIDKYLEAFGR